MFEFRANQDSAWTGDESAKELFYVRQKIAKRVKQTAVEEEPNLESNLQTMQENIHDLEENVTPHENEEENYQTAEQMKEDFISNVDHLNTGTPSQPETSVINITKHIEQESPSTRKHLQPISPAFASAYFPGTVENTDGNLYEISTMTFSTGNTFRWPEQCDKIWYLKDAIEEKIAVPTLANSRGFYRVPEMDKFMPKI